MGLGKTMQLLAFLLRRVEESPGDGRPALLVAPTSVVGNWEREIARFAPSLTVTQHYGAERLRNPKDFPKKPGSLVVTTYGLLRRDAELLAGVDWSVVALDEAQNIKNAASATARAARLLPASHRVALTGTPVENRLAELWSILEFANPGLLGPLETFRRELAVPIERYGDDAAAARLRRIVSPFVLRRLKSDPAIIAGSPGQERDEGRLHAHARAGHALQGGRRRRAAAHRGGRGHRAARSRARAPHLSQADLQPPGAVPRRRAAALSRRSGKLAG